MTNDSPPDLRAWPASPDNPLLRTLPFRSIFPFIYSSRFFFHFSSFSFYLPIYSRLLARVLLVASVVQNALPRVHKRAVSRHLEGSFSMSSFTVAVFLSRAYSFCRISGIFFLSYADPRDVATDSRRKYCRREKFLSNILYICVHRCVLFVSRVFDFETCEFRGYSSSIRADG